MGAGTWGAAGVASWDRGAVEGATCRVVGVATWDRGAAGGAARGIVGSTVQVVSIATRRVIRVVIWGIVRIVLQNVKIQREQDGGE